MVMVQEDFSASRRHMVESQIAARGVGAGLVLAAMGRVPREAFVPEPLRAFAYEDGPLPIGEGQTISQPFIVALMTEALGLKGGEKVLEIGTGSGYAAAVLADIASEVYSVERLETLVEHATGTLARLGYRNVHLRHADGTLGWPEEGPFDAIVATAGGPRVPASLKAQLKIGGRLVMPVGRSPRAQELLRVTRTSDDRYRSENLDEVRFVPLVGQEGWSAADAGPGVA